MQHVSVFQGTVTVIDIRARSDDGLWAVLRAVDVHGEVLTLVGSPLGRFAEPGRRIDVQGRWQDHATYGRQLHVRRASAVLAEQAIDAEVVLLLKRIPHVGAKRAQLLIDHFGEEGVVDGIDLNPRRAFSRVAGLPFSHAAAATRWWRSQRVDPRS